MATFTVTNLFDSGDGSLRDFISTANGNDSADIIDFDTSLEGGTINLTSGVLKISDSLTVNGLGAKQLQVDAGGNSPVFSVGDENYDDYLEVAIKGLTITGGNNGGINNGENLTLTNSTISGNSGYNGGGIFNSGSLTVNNSIISNNSAERRDPGPSGSGGGIFNLDRTGNLTVNDSIISGNTADSEGGGIYTAAFLTVNNSTISGNTAGFGGGITNYTGNATITNSTISGNAAERIGGGIASYRSNTTVTNSTISGNTAEEDGGISNGGITATVTSSIIAANTDNKDIDGTSFISGGNNLIGNGNGAEGFTNGVKGDLVGTTANPVDPRLGPLQNNGGSTQTQALLSGSPAINAGSNPLNLEFDQRGPGFDRVVGTQADIGAVAVPEPDSTLGLLGMAVLGVVFLRKHQRQQKLQATTQENSA